MILGGGSSCQQCGCGPSAPDGCRCSLGMLDADGHQMWDETYYPSPDYDGTNPCCSPTCLPCSLTVEFTPGNTWSGPGSGSLTSTDKSEIRAFLTTTIVCELLSRSDIGTGIFEYAHYGSDWMAFVPLLLSGLDDGSDACEQLSLNNSTSRVPDWNALGDASEWNIMTHAIATRYSSSSIFTATSGVEVLGMFQGLRLAEFPPSDGIATRVLPFTGYELCSSGSTSDLLIASHVATGAGINVDSRINLDISGTSTHVNLRGSTVAFSW